MNLFAVFFVCGATWVLQCVVLPPALWLWACFIVFLGLAASVARFARQGTLSAGKAIAGGAAPQYAQRQRLKLVVIAGLGLSAGALLSATTALSELDHKLDIAVQGRDIEVDVRVIGLPSHGASSTRFRAEVVGVTPATKSFTPRYLQLSWFHQRGQRQSVVPKSGEIWHLSLRLKPPRGLSNPGGFDYAGWLFQQRIHALGYVRNSPVNRRLARSTSVVQQIRRRLDEQLRHADFRHTGVLRALVTGQREGIEQPVWQLLRASGTSHLLAISGLHIGMVATCAFFIGHLLLRNLVFLGRHPNAVDGGGVFALLAATGYSLLAGFTLPTQRALCMVVVVVMVRWRRRHLGRMTPLSLAAVIVLLLDPLAPLAPGFWLSFGAVTALFYVSRYTRRANWQQRLGAVMRMHLALGLLLLPLTAWFFGQVSLIAPVANSIAVPFMSLIIVPLLLLWTILQCLVDLGQTAATTELSAPWLLALADAGIHWLLQLLSWLGGLPLAAPMLREVKPLVALAALAGVVLCYLPRCPERYLAIPLLLPLLASQLLPLRTAGLTLQVLDVGQGLAVLVSVGNRHLLYDTGGRLSVERSLAAAVITPVLQHQGVRRLDRVLISHSDLDHAAGLEYLREYWPADKWLLPPSLLGDSDTQCAAGERWQWGGARFTVLWPEAKPDSDALPLTATALERALASDNNRSCVLKIRYAGHDILLPGDIEKPAERKLTRAWIQKRRDLQQSLETAPWRWHSALRAQLENLQRPLSLLVAPHHGSKTSSTSAWLDFLQPERVVYAVGHLNRFGFPHETVQMRYKERGVREYRTDRDGALRFHVAADGRIGDPGRQRQLRRRLWHEPSHQPDQCDSPVIAACPN